MTAVGGCWIHAQLAYDVANGAEIEGTNVAGGVGWIGAGGCEEVVVAVGEVDDVGAVELSVQTWAKHVSYRLCGDIRYSGLSCTPGGMRGYVNCVKTGI